jgi:small subunit ribosomal protein S5
MPDKKRLPDKEETKIEIPKKVDDAPRGVRTKREFDPSSWVPKTDIGRKVKSKEIKEMDEIFELNTRILESEIVDMLIPNLDSELLAVGQSKGKFGGGKRSIWRQTQKKTAEGNKPKFSTFTVVGNRKGLVGVGLGKAKETMPAREKSLRQAKLNLIKIKFGCGAWACSCGGLHTIPFKVVGKSGSVKMVLKPAPKGTGLKIEKECSKILELAGIKDVYSKTFGHTATKLNLLKACFQALKKLSKVKRKEEKKHKEKIIKPNGK